MGRVLASLEVLDRHLQNGSTHPLLGAASLHASLIHGGRELSSYPDRAWLEFERRTLPGEPARVAYDEATAILDMLRAADPEFEGDAKAAFGRAAYEIDPASTLPADLVSAARATGSVPRLVGMTFWTDAAILGGAGIPAVVFGPGGAGLHSTEEYVNVDGVCRCRDALVQLARAFTGQ
jgi:acetylornithine deacetylase